jgi:hypothetical protein
MKSLLLLTVLASLVLAQAKPQSRIPIRKETKTPAAAIAPPAARVVIHDTVIVYKTDTLGVFQSAVASSLPDTGVPAACHGWFLPIPIPIPFTHSHSGNAGAIATTASPEPSSLTLVGTGLLGLTLYVKRNKK